MKFPGPTRPQGEIPWGYSPRDLLSWRSRTSSDNDAGHDVEAEVDGERNEDAGLFFARREVRLSGVNVWAVLLDEDGPRLSGHGTV